MNSILKNTLAVLAGIIVGMIVNMGLITIGPGFIPPPEGADQTTMEGLKASMHLLEPKHYIFPFLAHFLGTLCGAVVTCILATSKKIVFGIGIGGFFLIGGIANILMLPSPLWFSVLDLTLAYIPAGYIAANAVIRKQNGI